MLVAMGDVDDAELPGVTVTVVKVSEIGVLLVDELVDVAVIVIVTGGGNGPYG